jgi:putative redox protein
MDNASATRFKDGTATVFVRGGTVSGFAQNILAGRHQLKSDEPLEAGGTDTGPSPYDLLLANAWFLHVDDSWPVCEAQAMATRGCSGSTQTFASSCSRLRRLRHQRGMLDRIEREIVLTGPLTEEQRTRLLEIANKCPVHRTLTSEINIQSWLA